jgi:hypothetical protein
MPRYNFAIKRGDVVIHSVENVPLPNPTDAWDVIDKLTSQFAAPGLRVVVKDDEGSVVIMAGLIGNAYSGEKKSA